MRIQVPSARNVEIYHRLVEDAKSVRDVAEEFWISPTRVQQIEAQVHRWYQHSAPDPEDRYRRQHAVAACKRHQSRSGRLYARMMQAFDDSQGEERRSHEVGGRTVTTVRMNYGEGKYLTLALRYSREQRDAALLLSTLGDEYFVPVDAQYVPPTEEELKLEAEEDRPRQEAAAEHSEKVRKYVAEMEEYMSRGEEDDDGDDEELDEDDFAPEENSESPERVCTPATPGAPAAAVTVAMPPRATAVDESSLDVAEILRQQARHDRRKKISPVQPSAANEEKRKELAAKLFGT